MQLLDCCVKSRVPSSQSPQLPPSPDPPPPYTLHEVDVQWIKKVFAHHAKQRYLTTQRAYDQTNEFIGFVGVENLYFNYVWSLICTTTPINNQKPTFDNQKVFAHCVNFS